MGGGSGGLGGLQRFLRRAESGGDKLNTRGGDTREEICMEKVYDSLSSSSRNGRDDFFEHFISVRSVGEVKFLNSHVFHKHHVVHDL
jgi:hypothetical protein